MIKSQLGLLGNNRQDLDDYHQAFCGITIILRKWNSRIIAKDKLSLERNSITVKIMFENEKNKRRKEFCLGVVDVHNLCNRS